MTNKQHFNLIVNRALTINRHLDKLREECEALIDVIIEHKLDYDYDDYVYELALLEETLDELKGFDLEDSIPEKATCEY